MASQTSSQCSLGLARWFVFFLFFSRTKSSENKSVLKTQGKLKFLFSFSVEEETPPILCVQLDGQWVLLNQLKYNHTLSI